MEVIKRFLLWFRREAFQERRPHYSFHDLPGRMVRPRGSEHPQPLARREPQGVGGGLDLRPRAGRQVDAQSDAQAVGSHEPAAAGPHILGPIETPGA